MLASLAGTVMSGGFYAWLVMLLALAAVILDVTHPSQAAETFTSGNWPATVMNTGIWRFTFTPAAASTAYVGGNFHALWADQSNHGGLWLNDAKLEMYTAPGDALVFSQAMTWSASQTITITVDTRSGTRGVTISGATTGNGTFTFTDAGPYFDGTQSLGCGSLPGSSAFRFDGAIGDMDDTNTGASGVAAITTDAVTTTATGVVPVTGSASIALGAVTTLQSIPDTTLGAFDPELRPETWFSVDQVAAGFFADELIDSATGATGSAAITTGAVTVGGTGVVPVVGTASPTLDAVTVSGTGTANGGILGAASITTDAITVSGQGNVPVVGTASPTLADVTVSGTGQVPRTGSASIATDAVTAAGTGVTSRLGSAAVTLADVTVQATSALPIGIGNSAVKQRINALNPSTGTLSTFSTDAVISSVTNGTDTFTSNSHGMTTADGPFRLTTSGTFPTGSNGTTDYWVNVTGANTFKLSTSDIDAVAGTVVNITSDGSGTITLVRTKPTHISGSAFVLFCARGVDSTSPNDPTDSPGNTLVAAVGSPITYAGFPNSKVRIGYDLTGLGSATHTVSATWGDTGGAGDELLIGMIEVTGVTRLQDSSVVERTNGAGPTITSNSVTTTDDAILLMLIFGNGPTGHAHNFTLGSGFTKIPGASAESDLSGNGYIQVTAGYKLVGPGTFTGSANGISDEGGIMVMLAFQAREGNPAAASITLGGVTISGTGEVTHVGQAAITTAAVTTTAAAQIGTHAAGAATLADVTVAGTAQGGHSGTASVAVDAVTVAAQGNVPVQGQASITTDAVTAAGTGNVPVTGAANITTGAVTSSAQGNVPVVGQGSVTQDATTVAGTGVVPVVGSGGAVLDAVTVVGTGVGQDSGQASIAVDAVTVAGQGVVPVVGTASPTLAGVGVSGQGVVPVQGQANITTDATTVAGVGSGTDRGQLAATLADVGVAGTAQLGTHGQAAITTGAVSSAGAGVVPVVGQAAIAVGAVTLQGGVVGPMHGAAAITLDSVITTIASGVVNATPGRRATAEGYGYHRISLTRARTENLPNPYRIPRYRG